MNVYCVAWLPATLTPLRQHTSVVKDTFDFLNYINGLFIDSKEMASLYVKSVFTNIPVQFVINFA